MILIVTAHVLFFGEENLIFLLLSSVNSYTILYRTGRKKYCFKQDNTVAHTETSPRLPIVRTRRKIENERAAALQNSRFESVWLVLVADTEDSFVTCQHAFNNWKNIYRRVIANYRFSWNIFRRSGAFLEARSPYFKPVLWNETNQTAGEERTLNFRRMQASRANNSRDSCPAKDTNKGKHSSAIALKLSMTASLEVISSLPNQVRLSKSCCINSTHSYGR